MNCGWGSPAMQAFDQAGLTSSFGTLKWPPPQYTCWAGSAIDYVLFTPPLQPLLLGSYVYHTASSDHLPIIVDLRMSEADQLKLLNPIATLPSSLTTPVGTRGPDQPDPVYQRGALNENNKKLFLQEETQRALRYNQSIPPVGPDTIRVVTFNVHTFKHAVDNASNVNQVLADIQRMNGTIVILQEVRDQSYAERKLFDQRMTALGYQYQLEGFPPNFFLGNVMYSKLPLRNPKVHQLGGNRTLMHADVGVDNDTFTICGTHLEDRYDDQGKAIRKQQAEAILNIIPKNTTSLIAGDMNCTWGSEAMKVFQDAEIYHSWAYLDDWEPPKYTCWRGTAIDYALITPSLWPKVQASYVYHTASSDHLPIIVDLRMSQANQVKAANASTQTSKPPPTPDHTTPPPDPTPSNNTSSGPSGSSSGPSSSGGSSTPTSSPGSSPPAAPPTNPDTNGGTTCHPPTMLLLLLLPLIL